MRYLLINVSFRKQISGFSVPRKSLNTITLGRLWGNEAGTKTTMTEESFLFGISSIFQVNFSIFCVKILHRDKKKLNICEKVRLLSLVPLENFLTFRSHFLKGLNGAIPSRKCSIKASVIN